MYLDIGSRGKLLLKTLNLALRTRQRDAYAQPEPPTNPPAKGKACCEEHWQ